MTGERPRVVVVGAGASGICAGVLLQRELGTAVDYVVYEKSAALGGTWHDNTYPGCSCDVPSHNYVFSFELNPDYTRLFTTREEIWRYFDRVARKYDVFRHIRFQTEVVQLAWDERVHMWRVQTRSVADGTVEESLAHFVIAGPGGLNRPKIPKDLAGVGSFAGPSWHSAQWNHTVDLRGKRVAVIGSGASAVQIVPELADVCSDVCTYQRTANWVLPQFNENYPQYLNTIFRNVPGALSMYRLYHFYLADLVFFHAFKQRTFAQAQARRLCLGYIHSVIKDPELRKKVTPDYEVGCKRILFTDKYFPALLKPNVHLITDAIERITPKGVRTMHGVEREFDAIVYATGFLTEEYLMPIDIRGVGGVSLHEHWQRLGGAQAYLGVMTSGFPNMFFSLGPNTGLGHNSVLPMIEASAGFSVKIIARLVRQQIASADVKAAAQKRYNDELQEQLKSMVWAGGCNSWYKFDDGRIGALWSGRVIDYMSATSAVKWADLDLAPRVGGAARARL